MPKTLIIAEKPSVARDIAKALGGFQKEGDWLESKDAIVTSGIGHLVAIDVPEAESTGRSLASLPVIPQRFSMKPIDRTKSQLRTVTQLLARKDVDLVVNACDAGREGELIFRLIYEFAQCAKPMKRMWLQSMTADAIRDAHKNMRPGAEFDALSDAAKCRSEADWLVGINGSRGISRLHSAMNGRFEMMSAGRVQTPTLAILVRREHEIANFVPAEYYEVHGTFTAAAGEYVGKWLNVAEAQDKEAEDGDDAQAAGHRIPDKSRADEILRKCKGTDPSSVTDTSKKVVEPAPRLYDLTTLQRDANKAFKFSAQKTLDIAQSLYEKHKATSYPRTDAAALPEDYVPKAVDIMSALKGEKAFEPHADRVLSNGWIKPDKRIFDNSKISDHFAIIPTGSIPASLTADEQKLYDMIVRRFMAAFHPPAEYSRTVRITVVAGESFKTTGRVLLVRGWQEVHGRVATDPKQPALCAVAGGEQVKNKSMVLKKLATKPPKRYTEATLLSAMEGAGKLVEDEELRDALKGRGLGTPATRAATIEGLLGSRSTKTTREPYVRREGKEQYLVPTAKGINLIDFLDNNGIEALTSPRMTGEWESKLAAMEKGKYDRATFMDEIATLTRQVIDIIRTKAGSKAQEPEALKIEHACPSCAGALHSRGEAVMCGNNCGFRLWGTVAGKTLSSAEVNALLETGKTGPLSGFMSRARKPFTAALAMDKKGKVTFSFAGAADAGVVEGSAPELGVPCAVCGGKLSLMSGSIFQYGCTKGHTMWRRIAGRILSEEELATLVKEGQLQKVSGFISTRTNRPFEAGLRLSDDRTKIEFVFSPR